MKLYLDDDSANALLVRLLTADGHDVLVPHQIGKQGRKDPVHFLYALSEGRALLTHNHRDFDLLHDLVVRSGGHHPGVLVVRKDNDRNRDLSPKGIVRALRKLLDAGVPTADELIILNTWR